MSNILQNSSQFEVEVDFCPECGTILPLPGMGEIVTCKICGFHVSVYAFDGQNVTSEVVFNDRNRALKESEKDTIEESSGPLVDRKCSKCGHEGMSYATLQTRSADEGQTVFYTCPQCRFHETENS